MEQVPAFIDEIQCVILRIGRREAEIVTHSVKEVQTSSYENKAHHCPHNIVALMSVLQLPKQRKLAFEP